MIPKKLVCSFVFMSFLLSHENVVAMIKKGVTPFQRVLLNQKIVLNFMNEEFALKLGGNTVVQSIEDQWKRFIRHAEREIDFGNVTNSLNGLYPSFVKEISTFPMNESKFDNFVLNYKELSTDLGSMNLEAFLNQNKVKDAFMFLGANVISQMQNSSSSSNSELSPTLSEPTTPTSPGSIVTPPPAPILPSTLSETRLMKYLLSPNLDSKSAKAIEMAGSFLGVESLSRDEIEQQYVREMDKIRADYFGEKQAEMIKAAEVAADILKNQVEVEEQNSGSDSQPGSDIEPSNDVDDFNAFIQAVQNGGMMIAQSLFNQNVSVVTERNIQSEIFGSIRKELKRNGGMYYDKKMAYLMGYVQNCIWLLQNSAGIPAGNLNPAQAVSNLIQVLSKINERVSNMQARRA